MEDILKIPDIELVSRIKENACSDSFNELARRHSNLFYKVCQNYIKTLMSLGYCQTDIFEERDIVLFEAILKFNPDKGAQFSTWLGNYSRFFCLNKITAAKNMPEVGTEEEMEAVFNDTSVKAFENKQPQVNLDGVFKTLDTVRDARMTNIFKLRYDPNQRKKRTWANIANQLGLTVQTTIQLHKKGLKLLQEEIANKQLDVYVDA